jgi:LPS sulfotransferase NodH
MGGKRGMNVDDAKHLPAISSPFPYLLCCTPRTGSWLLAEALRHTGVAGFPDEFFSHEKELQLAGDPLTPATDAVHRWLDAVRTRGTSNNGVLGLKAHVDQLEHLIMRLQLLPGAEPAAPADVLRSAYPGIRLIWSRRRDKVRQAVSWYRSLYSGSWFEFADGTANRSNPAPAFDYEAVATLHRRVLAQEAIWHEFFATFAEPCVVDYEDLASSYADVVPQVLDHLGLALPAGTIVRAPRLVKQADEASEAMVERYREQSARRVAVSL